MATAAKTGIGRRGIIRRVYGFGRGLLASVLLTAGCASDGRTAVTGSSPPPADITSTVRADEVFSPGPRARTVVVFDTRSGERLGSERDEAGPMDDRGRWVTQTLDIGEGRPPPRQAGYRRMADGSITLEWSRSVKDTDPHGPARLFVFDPPLVMMPGVLAAGETFEASSRMTERDPTDESRVAMSGRARRTVRVAASDGPGWDPAWLAEGTDGREAVAVVGEIRISVGPAQAVRRTVRVLIGRGAGKGAAGRSEVAELVDYSIRVLGIPFKRERTRAVPVGSGTD